MAAVTQPADWADDEIYTADKLNAVSALQDWYWGHRPLFHACSGWAELAALPEGVWYAAPLRVASGIIDGVNRGFTFTESTSVVTATVPGWYDVCWQVGFQSTAHGNVGVRGGGVAKNGTGVSNFEAYRMGLFGDATTTDSGPVYSGNATVYLNGTTDYLQLMMFKTTGVSGDILAMYANEQMRPKLGIWWVGRDA